MAVGSLRCFVLQIGPTEPLSGCRRVSLSLSVLCALRFSERARRLPSTAATAAAALIKFAERRRCREMKLKVGHALRLGLGLCLCVFLCGLCRCEFCPKRWCGARRYALPALSVERERKEEFRANLQVRGREARASLRLKFCGLSRGGTSDLRSRCGIASRLR